MNTLAVLRAHRMLRGSIEDAPECTCGKWEPATATRDLEEHEEHIAAELEAALRAQVVAA